MYSDRVIRSVRRWKKDGPMQGVMVRFWPDPGEIPKVSIASECSRRPAESAGHSTHRMFAEEFAILPEAGWRTVQKISH